MTEKSKGQKWDGKSRVSNDLYRKNYDDIFKKELRLRNKTGVTATTKRDIGHSQELSFGFPPPVNNDPFKKEQDELKESYEQSKRARKEREDLLKEIEDRNGF
jgi:hypothetical protein